MKIATYLNIEYNYEAILNAPEGSDDYMLPDFVRLTEWLEVEFIPLNKNEASKALLNKITKKIDELEHTMQKLRGEKENYLLRLENNSNG